MSRQPEDRQQLLIYRDLLSPLWVVLLSLYAVRIEAQAPSNAVTTVPLPEVFDAAAIPPPDLQPYLLPGGRFIDKCRYWHDHPDADTRRYGQPDKFAPGQPMGETRSFNGQPAPYLRCAVDPCPPYGAICWRNPARGHAQSPGNMTDTMKNVDASCRRVAEQGGSRPGCPGGPPAPAQKPLQGNVGTEDTYRPPLEATTYQFDGQWLKITVEEGWPDNHQIKGIVNATYFGTAEGTVGTKKDAEGHVMTSNGQPMYYFNLRSLTVRATGRQLIPQGQTVEIPMQVQYRPY